MSKLLTQEEIDALLSQEQGEDRAELVKPKKEYRLYDFRRPERVSKDQIKILRNIHEIFARLLSPYLSNQLRTMVDVKSPVIDQVTYLEFTMSASEYTNMYIFEIESLDGQAILDVDPGLTAFIIDRVFGGSGSVIPRRAETITTIEQSVMKPLAIKILEHLKTAWAQIDVLEPLIVSFETNPSLVTIAPSSETMIVLNFPVTARTFEFTILICFPYFMLEPLLKKLMSQNYSSLLKKESTLEDQHTIQHTLEQTFVPTVVSLGSTELPVQDFIELDEGHILVLDAKISQPLTADVGGVKKFQGSIGVHNKKLVYRIENLLDSEGEVIHDSANR
jgi:flagellar motor switch protein FliM